MGSKRNVTQDLKTPSRMAPGVDQEESHLSIDSSVSINFASGPGLCSQAVHSTDKTAQFREDKISRKEDTLSGVPRGYPLLMILPYTDRIFCYRHFISIYEIDT